MAKIETLANTLPEIWLEGIERVPDNSTPPLIHQGADPFFWMHDSELLGFSAKGVYRLPNPDELKAWYHRQKWTYNQIFAHESLTSLAYKQEGWTQTRISNKKVFEGYTLHLQKRAVSRMGTAIKGVSQTGGVSCNYGSELNAQLAILGVAADARWWTDEFYEDLSHAIFLNFQKYREARPEYADIICRPYQTEPGTGGGWGDGLAKAKGGDGIRTGKYRMTRKELRTRTRKDGHKFNFAGHIHAPAKNDHWDPSSYFKWVEVADRVNELLRAKARETAPKKIATPVKTQSPLDIAQAAIETAKYQLAKYRSEQNGDSRTSS